MAYMPFIRATISTAPGAMFGLAAFLFFLGGDFGPEKARAQTAEDLRCNKCVHRRDIRKGAVSFNRLQRKLRKRITDLESEARQEVPFYIVLDGNGAEQSIATNGSLEVFARCRIDDAGRDKVQIVFTNSTDGWFAVAKIGGERGPFRAFEEVISLQESDPTGSTDYDNDDSEGSAAAPDGSVIGIAGEATGLGVNIFGHDCIAIGSIYLANGTP